jgi:hypothetical protein
MGNLDWTYIGSVAIGCGLGGAVGFTLKARRPPRREKELQSLLQAKMRPIWSAFVLAIAVFFGVSLATDAMVLMGDERAQTFLVTKYLFAITVAIGQYAVITRRPLGPA